MKDLILFGMQGSGKGTQGNILAAKYGYQMFDTGAALRNMAKEASKLGQKVKTIMNEGKLVPAAIVMEVLEDFIKKQKPGVPLIFDGIPRSEEQRIEFERIMEKVARLPLALYIKLERQIAEKRLLSRKVCKRCHAIYGGDLNVRHCQKCGGDLEIRKDDNPEAIKQRIDIFFLETLPIIEYYQVQHRLIEISGELEISEVTKEIETKISFQK